MNDNHFIIYVVIIKHVMGALDKKQIAEDVYNESA